MEGWFKIYRKLCDSPLWLSEPFTRGQAWIDLIYLASYSDTFFFVRGNRVDVKTGQVAWSEPKLALRWQWSRTKLRSFLNMLEKEQQIIQHKNNITQIVTIVNYEKYQEKEQQIRQQKDSRKTAERQQKDVLEESKEVKKDNTNVLSLSWRSDFNIYLSECKQQFSKYYNDAEFIKRQQVFYPNVNIQRSIWKAYENYWGTEEGWANKKKSRTADINWKQTIVKALSFQTNKVYYTKEELAEK